MTAPVHTQLLADLEDAVRMFPAAICEIKDLRGEMQYLICNFPGMDVQALYIVTSRYTETDIVVEPAGNGQDRYVIKSKHSATIKSGAVTWWLSWFTLRNIVTLLLTLASVTNLFLTSPFLAQLFFSAMPSTASSSSPAAAKTNSSSSTAPPDPAKTTRSGFTIF